MKKIGLGLSATLVAISLLFGPQLFSQDNKDTKDKQTKADAKAGAKKENPKEGKKDAKGRLPNYYGQIGLSDDQKKQIYDIQAKHDPEIERLKKELAALQDKVKAEVEEVLSAEQKTKLAELTAAAKEKSNREKEAAAQAKKASDTLKPTEALIPKGSVKPPEEKKPEEKKTEPKKT